MPKPNLIMYSFEYTCTVGSQTITQIRLKKGRKYTILSFSLYGNSPFSKVLMQHAYSGFAASGITDPDGFFFMTPNITFEARTDDNLTIVHVANVAGKVYGCIAIEEEY